MNYKEIYDELTTVLWGDENANTVSENEVGVDVGYLIGLYDPCHNYKGKINPVYHQRVLKIFKKFTDKLYLETKDEYVIRLIEEACIFTGELWNLADMEDIMGTYEDPEYMFDKYDFENAKEPKPEDKYCLKYRKIEEDGSIKEEITNYKFYEEAKRDFDEKVSHINLSGLKIIFGEEEGEKVYKEIVKIDEENHFFNGGHEYIIEKRKD